MLIALVNVSLRFRKRYFGHERDDDLDPRGALAGAVADDDGLRGVVHAGRGDEAPLVLLRHRPARGEDVGHRDRCAVLVGGDDRVALLAVLEPSELPLAEPPGADGEDDDRHEEEEPAAAEEESPRRQPVTHGTNRSDRPMLERCSPLLTAMAGSRRTSGCR